MQNTKDKAAEQEVAISTEASAEMQSKSEEIIKKLDKESTTRTFSGTMKKIFFVLCILVSCYHLYTATFGPPLTLIHRSIHVSMMLVLTFLMYPMCKKSSSTTPSILDWILVALSLAAPIYISTDYQGFVERAGNANTTDMIMATLLVALVLEASRRVSGNVLSLLSLVFIAYGLFGRSMPGMFMHRGYDWTSLSNHFFANTEGIYGTSVNVAASYIFLFILFGAVMSKSGMGQLFNDLALALAGHTKGGPAKVSVIASGFLGSINGSAVANVVTTGAFTIPLMKKTGYSKEFAGAVESAASVGGQLLPPIMGAAAFIMAEMLGVKYSNIIVWAAIPALLYYLGIIIQVQLRASKDGLVGLPKDQLPVLKTVLNARGHLLLPVFFLLYMLFFSGTTVVYSAVLTIVVTIVVAQLKKDTRMSVKDMVDALANGAKQTVSVAIACACVGIIIGVCSKTGFGLTMANTIIALGGTSILFTLVFTMITCMILGMGLPSIPAYIITAAIAAPALAKLGIAPAAAHMFSFYYAMFANLTPPVALASFAAAGLSGGDPMKTGIASVKLAIAGFIVPFMFVFSPQLMLINTTLAEGAWTAVTACIGVFMLAVAVEGYFCAKVAAWLRLVILVGALGLMNPGMVTDAVGIACCIVLFFIQKKKEKALKAA
ncbi:TRAP transporter permease [Phascolarctobacterium sp.]|uniref:TRAP transporter permease n=1 Tax=Phascolarctobacterium sp. TaxID=2049039 RepID=UPI002A7FE08D|nr:TRAP transporter permease [Phascolarctobacterium sp.]MDY5045284.1 TRAP transporter permease [Phascolarctobacterium sp.]